MKLLTNWKPGQGYEEQFREKEASHRIQMAENIENDLDELTVEMFNDALEEIMKKPGDKYKFIVKGGQALIDSLFNLFYYIWKSEKIPSEWHNSELVQIFKGRGSISDLNMYRHIHLKNPVCKFFSTIVISQVKEELYKNMSRYQIATRPGHRAAEHIYTIKSTIAMFQTKKKALILSMWDISKMFDSEALVDVMASLYKHKVKGKTYKLLYKLNENIKITVNTPVGKTDTDEAGETVGQGTVDGAIMSAVSIADGVEEEFGKES